jgi:GntR family transcriptional repressor for pyruvate dehydrogenase complex
MRTLLAEIAGGDPVPGGTALRETDIAGRFGVSRGVARESVRGLEERGLVSVKPGLGATVTPRDRWAVFDPEVLNALLGARRAAELVGEYSECRRVLEVAAVGLAAQRAGDHDVAALAAGLERMEACARRAAVNLVAEDAFHDADVAFHEALVAATHNAALAAMIAPLWRALRAARRALGVSGETFERSIAEHRRILGAVESRDVEAARAAMHDHLARVAGEPAEANGDRAGDDAL